MGEPASIVLAWTATGFLAPESPAHDPARELIYVSNMAGDGWPPQAHGAGFISKLSPTGEIIDARWITGLHEAKNIEVRGDHLFVADVGRLLVIDVDAGSVVDEFPAPESIYLDGIAIDDAGNVFVSDLATNTIWRLGAGTSDFKPWVQSPLLDQPDGLVAEPDRLVAGGFGTFGPFGAEREGPPMGHLCAIDYRTGEVTAIGSAEPIGNIDGVVSDNRGGYLVADHVNGTLLTVDECGHPELLADVHPGVSDIEYIPELGLLVTAMMYDNTVVAYHYTPAGETPT